MRASRLQSGEERTPWNNALVTQVDPNRTTQDRKLMVKEPRTNGGPGSLSCWKGRSTAEPFHYWSLGFGRPRSI